MAEGAGEKWIAALAGTAGEAERRALVEAWPEGREPGAMGRLQREVSRYAYSDKEGAARLAEAAGWLAERLGDAVSQATAERCAGHIAFVKARYGEALEHYEKALAMLEPEGEEVEAARVMASGLQCLIYLDRYAQALDWAARARAIFERHGDELRLARLLSNIGNIHYRQDRHEEALGCYRQAYPVLRRLGGAGDVAAVLSNMAVCSISLGRFRLAMACYRRARKHSQRHGLRLLVAAADYNVAYLHYLRGEYLAAARLYQASRQHCREAGDDYHAALCDLDESEVCLELNLNEDGAHLARRAVEGFDRLGMGYERAKAYVSLATALSRRGEHQRAMVALWRARRIFSGERNSLWPALIDLNLALLWKQRNDRVRTERFCRRAYTRLSGSQMPGRAATCELLLGQLCLQRGDVEGARRWRTRASARLEGSVTPVLECQAHYLEGQIEERAGNAAGARARYQDALSSIDRLRDGLWSDDARISFLRDKLPVYESLVALCLRAPEPRLSEALGYIEQAKSRSLAERIAEAGEQREGGGAGVKLRQERLDLHALYRQMENAALGQKPEATRLRMRVRERERAYLRRLAENAPLETPRRAAAMTPGAILEALPKEAALVNYFEIGGRLYACVAQRGQIRMVEAGEAETARRQVRLLQLQLSKYHLGPAYLPAFEGTWREATETHLRRLHEEVFAPVRKHLRADHVILSPHGFLHHLPFHALYDGAGYLIDEHAISYTPSASVLALCRRRRAAAPERSLVLGVPDALAPQIEGEARLAAERLPGAKLLMGEQAKREVLFQEGESYRYLHLATHGLFRADNPAFSYIRLGDAHLTMLDLEGLRLNAELVTLSGCGTGLSAVIGADELIGLMRGVLAAGARSLLVSLWDVHDEAAAEFFASFYGEMGRLGDKAGALREAVRKVRSRFGHPFYWAPFLLVGDYEYSGKMS